MIERAQGYVREEQYGEAEQFLLTTRGELNTAEIDAILATVRKKREAFERRREEIFSGALQLLE